MFLDHDIVSFFPIQYSRCSMYGIFTYISPKLMVNVGKYSIHGSYGYSRNVPTEWTFYDQKKTTYIRQRMPTTAAQETLTKSIWVAFTATTATPKSPGHIVFWKGPNKGSLSDEDCRYLTLHLNLWSPWSNWNWKNQWKYYDLYCLYY